MPDLKVLWDHEISLTKLIFSLEIDFEVIVSVTPSLNCTDVKSRSHSMASCTDIDTKILEHDALSLTVLLHRKNLWRFAVCTGICSFCFGCSHVNLGNLTYIISVWSCECYWIYSYAVPDVLNKPHILYTLLNLLLTLNTTIKFTILMSVYNFNRIF